MLQETTAAAATQTGGSNAAALSQMGFGNLLQEQNPYDPAIYGLVLALMAVVSIAATLIPTVRALRVDPAAALRYE